MAYNKSDAQLINLTHNLTFLRRQHGLTKTAMARLLHTSVRTITRLENNEIPHRLSASVLFYAHMHFLIPPHKLLSEYL